jgi:hypothetical protein
MIPYFNPSTVHLIKSCHCEPPLLVLGGVAISF